MTETMSNKKKKGFTLVELLVVIAILAILVTVTIIGYTEFIKRARLSNAEAEAAQVETVLQGHAALRDEVEVKEGDTVKGILKFDVNEGTNEVTLEWTGEAIESEDTTATTTYEPLTKDLFKNAFPDFKDLNGEFTFNENAASLTPESSSPVSITKITYSLGDDYSQEIIIAELFKPHQE